MRAFLVAAVAAALAASVLPNTVSAAELEVALQDAPAIECSVGKNLTKGWCRARFVISDKVRVTVKTAILPGRKIETGGEPDSLSTDMVQCGAGNTVEGWCIGRFVFPDRTIIAVAVRISTEDSSRVLTTWRVLFDPTAPATVGSG